MAVRRKKVRKTSKTKQRQAREHQARSFGAFPSAVTESLVAAGGFVGEYIAFAGGLGGNPRFTDAPIAFHVGAALTACGAALGVENFLEQGAWRTHTNLYTLFVGESTIVRKSTSVNIAADIFFDAFQDRKMPSRITPEALFEDLGEGPQKLMVVDEFSSLHATLRKDYSAGLLQDLTSLYDVPVFLNRRTLKHGLNVLHRPFLAILAATTESWLEDNLGESSVLGGWAPRFGFWPGNVEGETIALPPAADDSARQNLVLKLTELAKCAGEMTMSRSAQRVYSDWYKPHRSSLAKKSPLVAPLLGRLETVAIKLAMILERSSTGKAEITFGAMELAVQITDWLTAAGEWLLGDDLAFTPGEKRQRKVLQAIHARFGIDEEGTVRRDVLQATRFDLRELDLVIQTLEAAGKIRSGG